MHKYTEEEKQFMAEYVPGHTYHQIKDELMKKFGVDLKISMIKGYIGNHHLNTGMTGRFPKGNVPANKGTHIGGWKPTQFKKGHVPANHKPVGSERINIYGYIEIKIAEPNIWKLKQKYIWEQEHGTIPTKHVIIFLDGDKTNCKLSNLALVSQSMNLLMNRNDMRYENKECTESAIIQAQLIDTINKLSKS